MSKVANLVMLAGLVLSSFLWMKAIKADDDRHEAEVRAELCMLEHAERINKLGESLISSKISIATFRADWLIESLLFEAKCLDKDI